jgi:hypothetical protein
MAQSGHAGQRVPRQLSGAKRTSPAPGRLALARQVLLSSTRLFIHVRGVVDYPSQSLFLRRKACDLALVTFAVSDDNMPTRSHLVLERQHRRNLVRIHHEVEYNRLVGFNKLLSCRSCRPNAPFAELVQLSKTSVADEM